MPSSNVMQFCQILKEDANCMLAINSCNNLARLTSTKPSIVGTEGTKAKSERMFYRWHAVTHAESPCPRQL